ncbi:helix-turn-helix domain-containing protein [Erwinia sp. S63]|uniref:helix-turn-helix transcriptional regulator n=1 Tax=Erwinia sp. S63 TaxID=2769341 RepID=UPI00190A3E8A|nr:helix-turn-helix domain-containing protein [Erwinia sp. S63]MBK0095026.1 helix-turn-helix domain-containing protein [Erwinia sp. S63]
MNNLKSFRELSGLTQAELACLAGCTPGAICHWENGKRKMDIQLCHKFVCIFKNYGIHISVEDIYPPSTNYME